MNVNYEPDGAVLSQFMNSTAFVRGIQGPIGSGKTVCCVVESLRMMLLQEPSINQETGERTGPRLLRVGVIRNTTPQLETTTMKTWLEWMPEDEFGKVRWRAPYCQNIEIPMPDGSPVKCEVWFLALDRDEDVRKLLSFEFTFLFINEARELSHHIVTSAISRIGRYPRVRVGGPTHPCMIMDTNAPPPEHWWAIMSGQVDFPEWMSAEDRLTLKRPANWQFFIQPPAMLDKRDNTGKLIGYDLNPDRENAKWVQEQYYTNLIAGQTRDWIMNMLQNIIGKIYAGRAVYNGFSESVHVSHEPLEPVEGFDIVCGLDFGWQPAAVWMQDVYGQVRILDEYVPKDTHTEDFAKGVKKRCHERFSQFNIRFCGDPTGGNTSPNAQKQAASAFKIFRAEQLKVKPAYTNDPQIRIGAVQGLLNRMVDGTPAYLADARCVKVIEGKRGAYCYSKEGLDIDKKDPATHPADAEQYGVLELGYGKKLVGINPTSQKAVQAQVRQDIFNDRQGLRGRRGVTHSMLSRR